MTEWETWLAFVEARKKIAAYEEALVDALRRKVEAEICEAFFGFRPDWAPPLSKDHTKRERP
jgi:hypothetical protein